MTKIVKPAAISSEFKLSEDVLSKFEVVNVMLATDTLLFIDPRLLAYS